MKCHLTADLASNGSSASGHENNFAGNIAPDRLHMQIYRLSTQKIFNTHIAKHGDVHFLIDHLIDTRKHLDLARRLLTDLQQFMLLLILQCRYRNNDLLDIIFFCHRRDLFLTAYNRNSLQISTDLIRIVVYNARHFPVQVFAVLHLPDKHISGCPRSHNHRHHRL